MSRIVALVGLLTVVGLAASSSCGGGGRDNPCGLTPSGVITDGDFFGNMRFSGGAREYPLTVSLDATARTLAGWVWLQDAVDDYNGRFSAAITMDGAISGHYVAMGMNTGGRISGTVSGVTDNQSACGTWSDTARQKATWDLTRTAP
jgi:hypothetical protein